MDEPKYEVIIVGGSYAGLSAAMTLGRSLRKVLIIDGGRPCNRQTPFSHNFLTQDGVPPAAITAQALAQVQKYPSISFLKDEALASTNKKDYFEIVTASGKRFTGQKLILATGVADLLPPIAGFSACWGISVIHCPYCHGYEFKNAATGILADPEKAMHISPLVRNLTNQVTVLTNGAHSFTPEQLQRLQDHDIAVIDSAIAAIEHDNGYITNIRFVGGAQATFNAVYAPVPFQQRSLSQALGCQLTEQGYIQVTAFQETNVPGVYACGDNSNPMRSVASAVAAGNLTGAVVNKVLADASF